MSTPVTYPRARRPDRRRWVNDFGVNLAVSEWGDVDGPPLLLAHGGFDFAGTFDVFAPLLAEAGWRVVSWDQRGHGDSDHAVLYSWESDARDAVAVLDSTSREPVPFVGHSKGGSVMTHLADAYPHRCTRLVNLDGLPARRNAPDVPDHERTRMIVSELRAWLDHRAGVAGKERKPGTLDELAARRQRMNPRLSMDWLRYLVWVGGREDPDGWRWKLDPMLRFGGFGPWRPEWSMMRMPGLSMPVLGMLGLVPETMGWGTLPEDVERWLPPGATLVAFDDIGHFLHIEQPDRIADLVLDFLGDPPPAGALWAPVTTGHEGFSRPAHTETPVQEVTVLSGKNPDGVVGLQHGRSTLALHELHGGAGPALLLLHGLAERTPRELPAYLERWPGPVHGLDFTGHGISSLAPGGGFTAEILMADAAIALDQIGEATVLGRGLGAYVALLLAGARPDSVRGAILFDGAGISGGGNGPGSPAITNVDVDAAAPPDPFALAELSRDVRPPDYASTFARLALQFSPLDQPIFVASVNRPDWLDAVAEEPGVRTGTLEEALAAYSAS